MGARKPGWTASNPEIGRALGRHQLAKWLWRFAGGLHKPLTFRLVRLAELSGASYGRERDYRARLIEAAKAVSSLTDIDLKLRWNDDGSQVTLTAVKRALPDQRDVTTQQEATSDDNDDSSS